ncbi:MAG: 1-deoxy-D-xylulose-5-phosphate reductoisomerase [Bacteroidetes bacterium]|nr:1-deoxy-D-xylulose-5-phosphate reductoisomerase [Bacteroidota bacterium]MDA0903734.1 1-deoxy-D-xylulose-5-phosphate reductoisomerase [Bacteroidota bacterium]MDA1242446.1 1-deoxy-D-xylulose-5-phosphate reductoisomerase [Bacteroidota bacterium]
MRQPENEAPTRGIAVLGSTGSIGTQALDVIRDQKHALHVEVLSAHSNADLLVKQALEFKPNAVVIGDDSRWKEVHEALFDHGIKVYSGSEALEQVVETDGIDMVLTAMVGAAGLKPTLRAIEAGKHIALANKETLVVAGELVMGAARRRGVDLHPVDSEHSAIYQCLAGEFHNPIETIILTASGGPFRGRSLESLATVTKADALKHPNWDMGAKITIDSASLMNKGLEVIEAKWLFNLRPDQINVVVHPQSIVHSCVQFEDGSIKAQLGLPDMKLPIQYALTYPRRLPNTFPRFSFMDYPSLTFEAPDTETFRNLTLAFESLNRGGNAPAILNAANEVAVARFLTDDVAFLDLPRVVEHAMERVSHVNQPSLDDLIASDVEARRVAAEWRSVKSS